MRNPNGYGSVVYLGKNRRLPYAIRKTVKMEIEKGVYKQRYKYFGYYATQPEAILALAQLNQRRLDAGAEKLTFHDLFEEWFSRKSRGLAANSVRSVRSAYKNYCAKLDSVPILKITEDQMQNVIDECGMSYQTQTAIRKIFIGVMEYTQNRGLRADNPAALLRAGGARSVRPHTIFTQKAIDSIKSDPECWSILFLLYSGMRIEELLQVQMRDVNIDESYLIGGIKTEAGKSRIIPIHRYLLPFVKAASGQTYLVEKNGNRVLYENYRRTIWAPAMKKYGLENTPHDTRHTFISALSRAGVSDLMIQKIVGHTPTTTAGRVYIHISPEELVEAVNRLV